MSDRPARRDAAAVVGVISDTHVLLRPQAVVALPGCNCILEPNGRRENIILTRQLENTGCFGQFHFTPAGR